MSGRIRVGVIGVGHLGSYHVQKYDAIENVELVGVVDTDSQRSEEIADRHNIKAFKKYMDILNEVDAVSIAVPTEAHHEVAMNTLKAGVHVLIEKPITYELRWADELINAARERDLILQVGLVERFNPAVVRMEKMLTRPVFVESHRMNLFTRRGTDVDVVLDLMIHDLDIILHIISSEVKELNAVGMSVITEMNDIANARLIFENGSVANLTASRVSNEMLRKIRVFQQDAYISANCGKKKITVVRLDDAVKDDSRFPKLKSEKMSFPDEDPLADEINSFVNSVIKRSEPVVSGEDGRKALDYALQIIEQIKKGNSNSKSSIR